MQQENILQLQMLLQKLGFSGRTAWKLESYKATKLPAFQLFERRLVDGDFLLYALQFEKEKEGSYRLEGFSLSLTVVEIPDATIRDINILQLEESLKQVDRYYEFFLSRDGEAPLSKNCYQHIAQFIEATNSSLEQLASWKEGEAAAKLLMFKYWPKVRYQQHFEDYSEMEAGYKTTQYFPANVKSQIKANQSYQFLKTCVMNDKNYEYLKDSLKYAGFGEGLAEALKEQMRAGTPAFHLSFDTEINKKAFSAILSFRKSENTDMYFLNSYHATLTRNNGEVKDQAFYLNKGKGVTAKEAFNLLEGRAVYKEQENKEGQKYHAWLQIDFVKRDKNNNHEMKQFHEAYGYNLKDALDKYPIREAKEPDLRDILVASLQKGNMQAVAFEKDGGAVRMFVEANPQYKTINLYDSELKRVPKEQLQFYTGKGQDKELAQDQKQQNTKELKAKNGATVEKPKQVKSRGAKRSMGQ